MKNSGENTVARRMFIDDNLIDPERNKKLEKSLRGKKSRRDGAAFELKVRKDLEKTGWNVAKWTNNIDLEEKKMIPAKRKYNPFMKALSIGTGFPDFLAFMTLDNESYDVIGVECKVNGKLDRLEKDKLNFYLREKIFGEIWIASKDNEGKIQYKTYSPDESERVAS